MILARVEGSVVATKKNPKMTGSKFLVVRPLVIDSPKATEFKPGAARWSPWTRWAPAKAKWCWSCRAVPRGLPPRTRIRPWTPS